LGKIVHRHESLRTIFDTVNEDPIQRIQEWPKGKVWPITVLDYQDIPKKDRASKIQQAAEEEAHRPFDLAQGPLLRTTLLKLAEDVYILLLTMHHIISDGWSMGLFTKELDTLYQAFSADEASPLQDLTIQYADFAAWQRAWLQGDTLEKHLSYWRQALDGLTPVLQLTTDHPRPAIQTFQGGNQHFTIDSSVANALQDFSKKQGVTLFMTLLAAFKALLYRYTNQVDISVGSPIANRNRQEIEELIGFFINTLVLRTDLSGNPTFNTLLARVKSVTLDSYDHQDLPFEHLVEMLQPDRDLSHSPLFQVMFILQNAPATPLQLQGITITPIETENHTSKFDLTMFITETQQGLLGRLEYNSDLFDEGTASRLVGHWQTLLQGIVNSQGGDRLLDLPLLTDAEETLLREWNSTSTPYPLDPCLHQRFEAQVERSPEAPALIYNDDQLTYQELNERANQLAHHLRALGVGAETLVGIGLERSLEMVIAIYGILKAGGAYVPLDPTDPIDRLTFMMADANVPVLLTQAHLESTLIDILPNPDTHLICLDRDWPIIANNDHTNPPTEITSDTMAYTIYTSGSTGKPKGAMNNHRGIGSQLMWMQDTYQLTATDWVLQKTPFSFDVSIWEFFWPLLTGSCLVVAPPEKHKDSDYIIKLITEHQITTVCFVPSMLQLFLEDPNVGRCTSLKRVLCIGEALPFDLQERFFARMGAGTELHNLYGPTEAAVGVTYWECEQDSQRKIVPIGYPMANTQIYVLDSALQPVPIGVPGELHIGGVQVGRGYLNRPGLTAEKFIPDPFSDSPGTHMYKTGDLVRYLSNGAVDYLGRIDHQIKIRGFRIELGEIETLILQHPEIREAVVMVREDNPGDQRIIAYIVSGYDQETGNSTQLISLHQNLRESLEVQLPEYMVPSTFVDLAAFPLLPNGKINRHALPKPDLSRAELTTTYLAPRDTVEWQLAQIWQTILEVDLIGVRDNFFDLGGHSLLAIRLMAQIQKVFNQELPLAILFQGATIESLAKILRQQSETETQSSLVAIRSIDLAKNSTPSTSVKKPFFCIHPADGGILNYVDLARHLGEDQPFYGLQAVGINDDTSSPYTDIESMAAHYRELIQTVQPHGPYLIGGWSLGGVVAFELAQQLHQQNQTVDLLTLIDTRAPTSANMGEADLVAEFMRYLQRQFKQDSSYLPGNFNE
ncbi:MAG: amino acid adenylation domain-containing protein, partial [Chloroflexota bacterium]